MQQWQQADQSFQLNLPIHLALAVPCKRACFCGLDVWECQMLIVNFEVFPSLFTEMGIPLNESSDSNSFKTLDLSNSSQFCG